MLKLPYMLNNTQADFFAYSAWSNITNVASFAIAKQYCINNTVFWFKEQFCQRNNWV